MGPIETIPEEGRDQHCRRALRHMTILAGPNWASDEKLEFIVPWRRGKDGFFRHPVPPAKSMRESADDLVCEPTIMLPTRHNVMKLLARIHSFQGLSRKVKQRLQWAKR